MRYLSCVLMLCVFLVNGCQKTTVEGPAGKKLTLSKPANQTLKRGDNNPVKISINRDNFRDAVDVRFENLPKGVTVQDKDLKIPTEATSANITLRAADDATIVDSQSVTVTVSGPNGMKATETFKVTVKEKG